MANEVTLTKDVNIIKKDRMRFTKNTISSTLCYIAILFNALYFINIYSTDVNNYFYTIEIGISVVYNLLFMLFTFLCSEEVKNYSKGFSVFAIIIGALQIVRIFGIPMDAHNTLVVINKVEVSVIDDKQFALLVAYLIISSACCIAAGVIGLVKTITLENYKKETGLS